MTRLRTSHLVALAVLALAAAMPAAAATPAVAASAGTFTPTGSMIFATTGGNATLLPDGQVLITGGHPELYNPTTGTWAVTGQMNIPRAGATATLLPDGQVLVAGGTSVTGTIALSSAEPYNPATGTWSVTGSMHHGRTGCCLDAGAEPSATLLPDGQVLVAGGEDANFNLLSSAELYNPATGMWSRTGSMTTPRAGQSAALLNNGQVLIAGGTGATTAAELYNPATGKFTATGSMISAHGTSIGTLLPDGDVLVTGRAQTFAELYHPATGQWSSASAGLPACIFTMECRVSSTTTLLGTGNVLLAGGLVGLISNPQTTATAMLYHPDTSTWTSTGSMTTAREGQTATLLQDGQVLMAGGEIFDHPHAPIGLASAELYTP